MTEREQDKREANGSQVGNPIGPSEELPYSIELWDMVNRESVERVLARAFSVQLAHAIFKAALNEHPGRRITLRHGSRTIADSAE
jgi:hypothetical protein